MDSVSEGKKDIVESSDQARHDLSKQVGVVMADIKNGFEEYHKEYKSRLNETKPVSFGKVALISGVIVVILTAACTWGGELPWSVHKKTSK